MEGRDEGQRWLITSLGFLGSFQIKVGHLKDLRDQSGLTISWVGGGWFDDSEVEHQLLFQRS